MIFFCWMKHQITTNKGRFLFKFWTQLIELPFIHLFLVPNPKIQLWIKQTPLKLMFSSDNILSLTLMNACGSVLNVERSNYTLFRVNKIKYDILKTDNMVKCVVHYQTPFMVINGNSSYGMNSSYGITIIIIFFIHRFMTNDEYTVHKSTYALGTWWVSKSVSFSLECKWFECQKPYSHIGYAKWRNTKVDFVILALIARVEMECNDIFFRRKPSFEFIAT